MAKILMFTHTHTHTHKVIKKIKKSKKRVTKIGIEECFFVVESWRNKTLPLPDG